MFGDEVAEEKGSGFEPKRARIQYQMPCFAHLSVY
jgi:hypothetical protein